MCIKAVVAPRSSTFLRSLHLAIRTTMYDIKDTPHITKDPLQEHSTHLEHVEKETGVSIFEDDDLGFWGTVKQSPKAIMWCTYMLFTCIMWGYDGLAAAIVISLPQFRQSYGVAYMVSIFPSSHPTCTLTLHRINMLSLRSGNLLLLVVVSSVSSLVVLQPVCPLKS
jgi:hypothetical protein